MTKKQTKNSVVSKIMFNQSDLDEFVGYNLKRAYMLVRSDFRANMGKDGLSPTSLAALSFIVQSPNITQSALAKQMGIERSGLVGIVDELEHLGFIERASVPGDRRVQALVPLRKGRLFYNKTLARIRAHELALFSDFSAAEKQQLLELLKKIRQHE